VVQWLNDTQMLTMVTESAAAIAAAAMLRAKAPRFPRHIIHDDISEAIAKVGLRAPNTSADVDDSQTDRDASADEAVGVTLLQRHTCRPNACL
jgi:O-methyltransferase involved in polyketide biosynthesis